MIITQKIVATKILQTNSENYYNPNLFELLIKLLIKFNISNKMKYINL